MKHIRRVLMRLLVGSIVILIGTLVAAGICYLALLNVAGYPLILWVGLLVVVALILCISYGIGKDLDDIKEMRG